MERSAIIRALRDMSLLLQLKGDNSYRWRAYSLAADQLARFTHDLQALAATDTLTLIPGVGTVIAGHIKEMLQTGQSSYLAELGREFPPGILELVQLPGIGPRQAATLWKELGVTDLASLEAACREGRVRQAKRFGAKSELHILEAIERLKRDAPLRVLGELLPIADELERDLRALAEVRQASVAGEVRRFCEIVGELMLVVASNEPDRTLEAFTAHPRIASVTAGGAGQWSFRAHPNAAPGTLWLVPEAQFAAALFLTTGAPAHVAKVKRRLEERGAWNPEQWSDEAALYAAAGLSYIAPELREDAGEVEQAAAGPMPRLVELGDVRGAVHVHSTWSDGKDSLKAMAQAAQAAGLEYLTVTDHSAAASYAGGLPPDALRRQWAEVDGLSAQLDGIRLLKGAEADILQHGALDGDPALLDQLDLVIGSVHMRHQQDEAAMTGRMLAALDDARLGLVGHPTGRLLLRREPYALRMPEVMDRAVARGVALEVNGSPNRLDLSAQHVREALAKGAALVVSSDAHSVAELSNLRYAVHTARRGGARREDVINTRSADDFVKRLGPGHAATRP